MSVQKLEKIGQVVWKIWPVKVAYSEWDHCVMPFFWVFFNIFLFLRINCGFWFFPQPKHWIIHQSHSFSKLRLKETTQKSLHKGKKFLSKKRLKTSFSILLARGTHKQPILPPQNLPCFALALAHSPHWNQEPLGLHNQSPKDKKYGQQDPYPAY